MDIIWYIRINDSTEGPYSFDELKSDRRLTPETLAWRNGFSKWLPICEIPELKDLFKQRKKPSKTPVTEDVPTVNSITANQLVLEANLEPPYYFWILVILTILTYLFFHLHGK